MSCANIGKIRIHTFVLPQTIPAFAGMVYLGDGGLLSDLVIVRTRHCEIPAYAGMVLWGNGNRGRIGDCADTTL